MTLLDDDRLASLFARAGDTFEVPLTGPDDIMAAAAGRAAMPVDGDGRVGATAEFDDTAPGRLRRVARMTRQHRVLSVAAVVVLVLVVGGAIAASVRGPARSTTTVAASGAGATSSHHTHAPAPAPAPARSAAPGPSGTTSAQSGGTFGVSRSPAGNAPGTTPTLPSGAVGQPAKIEQTGSLSLTVGRGDLGRTVTQLTTLAGAYGGFVASSQTQSGPRGGTSTGSVTLQVPVADFSTVLTRAEALGKSSDVTTSATDVTGQSVDLQSRLTALQDSRQQYLSILAKATTVGDILSVQEQLDTVQQQIEQLQGQLQLLTSQTSYSKLAVTVAEGTPPSRPSPLPESGLVRAWHESIGGFVTGVEGTLRLAGPLLFGLLLLAAVLTGGRALWRRHQRHNL